MKKSLGVFVCFLLVFAGCKNSLNVLAPYKDIPVIYGLLDQNDSIHYIRVNKAFEGQGNAYTMAQQYDSVNYPVGTITVQLQEYSGGNLVNTDILDTTTAIPMDSGLFAYPHQVLYQTTAKLNPNDQYTLLVKNEKTGTVVKGSTSLLPDVTFSAPTGFMSTQVLPISFNIYYPTTKVQWGSNSSALLYQLTLRFYYTEIDTAGKDTTLKYVDWVFASQEPPALETGDQMEDDFTGSGFLQFLKGSIPSAAGTNIKRIPGDVEVLFTSGTSDFYTYIELSQPSLTVNQEKPFYSNLTNAVGIFSARHVQSVFKPLPASAIDTLIQSSTVSSLNFQ